MAERKYQPLEHLDELRRNWSDEIPDEIIHSDSGILTKARRGWFSFVVTDVENALTENLITKPEGIEAARTLIEKFKSQDFREKTLTTVDEITEFNGLIDIILPQS